MPPAVVGEWTECKQSGDTFSIQFEGGSDKVPSRLDGDDTGLDVRRLAQDGQAASRT